MAHGGPSRAGAGADNGRYGLLPLLHPTDAVGNIYSCYLKAYRNDSNGARAPWSRVKGSAPASHRAPPFRESAAP
ncbi:hypothetical protein EVAR_34753_1 [Eumeta japonica]|uniref:Uncharacterized protein n=1 Tax=Eumeta variegata TaxID=151549 RepID=A0A4C1YGU5_EUMVA|nr:hypothetical protein EVAR_34753_1 [Eumeta japonica]